MHLSNIIIVMIKVWNDDKQLKTKFKTLCWELDSRNNHEIEYDSQILVSPVNIMCQDFQCVFRYEYLVLVSMQGIIFRKSLLCFSDAGWS